MNTSQITTKTTTTYPLGSSVYPTPLGSPHHHPFSTSLAPAAGPVLPASLSTVSPTTTSSENNNNFPYCFPSSSHGKSQSSILLSNRENLSRIWIDLYQELNLKENEIMQRIREGYFKVEVLNDNLKKMENILQEKSETIRQYLIEENEMKSKNIIIPQIRPADEIPGFVRNVNSGSPIIIEDQPYGNVVANKYLEPPLRVKVSDELDLLAKEGSLQVTAVLCGSLTETRINRTSDGKQNILQGYTILPITPEGYATFNKLKIMDVSSKHHHQPFSIQLQLQEIKKTGSVVNIGEPIKSSPLRVQSRINKKGTTTRSSLFNTKSKKKTRQDLDCNYIDITSLLVLPQKEAASKLGISESMLCKRFKECTRRKWPYRYLRKIDKMLQMFSPKSGYYPNTTEEQEKMDRLKRERVECLQPVKIRITGNDKVSVKLQSMITRDGVLLSETESEEGSSLASSQDLEEKFNHLRMMKYHKLQKL